ncbi:MAG: hypothetical protein AAGH60_15340 [Pseudomonadota bacterium]
MLIPVFAGLTLVYSTLMVRVFFLLTASVALTGPAFACNLHAPGQMGAFHRYNPFAAAMQHRPPAASPSLAQAEAKVSEADKAVKKEQEDRRGEKASEGSVDDLEDRIPDTQSGAQSRGAIQ